MAWEMKSLAENTRPCRSGGTFACKKESIETLTIGSKIASTTTAITQIQQGLTHTKQGHPKQAGNQPGKNDRTGRALNASPGGQENTSQHSCQRAGGLDSSQDLGIVPRAQ